MTLQQGLVIDRLHAGLFRQVDVASLVFFRITFGCVMLWEIQRYFDNRWIQRYWIDPDYNFPYAFFEWVRPWPGDGMYLHFYVMGALAVCIAVGLAYRLSATLFFLAFTYQFLLEQARYLNHFYLVILLAFLVIFVPAHRAYSLDAWIRPRLRTTTIPAWPYVLLAGQMGLVYTFGGVAKLNLDWLRGEPLRDWLARSTDFPLLGQWFTEEWLVFLFAYSALLLDLLSIPLLLWNRTRLPMFALLVCFHYMNDQLFSIEIFPWFAIAATTLFFRPDWPRRVIAGLWEKPRDWPVAATWAGAVALAAVAFRARGAFEPVPILVGATAGALLSRTFMFPPTHGPTRRVAKGDQTAPLATDADRGARVWIAAAVCVWFALQTMIPLRHFLIPGNASWTEGGHNFSWHMKLLDKAGRVDFEVTDRSDGSTWLVDPRDYLTSWQYRKMSTRPHMIHLFAQHLADEMADVGHQDVEVRARAEASLNGRKWQGLIDPTVDLSREPFRFGADPWILPLEEPLLPRPRTDDVDRAGR